MKLQFCVRMWKLVKESKRVSSPAGFAGLAVKRIEMWENEQHLFGWDSHRIVQSEILFSHHQNIIIIFFFFGIFYHYNFCSLFLNFFFF